jgi:hypothetical protein
VRTPGDVKTASAPFELPRRLLPTLLLIAGVWLTFSTYEKPYLMVGAMEPAREKTGPRAGAQFLLGPQAEEIYSARERQTPVVTVSGDQWTTFFDKVGRSFAAGVPVPEWHEHVVGHDRREIARSGKTRLKSLYFALDDPPFPAIADQLSTNRSFFLRLEAPQPTTLKLFVSPPYHPNLGASGPFEDSYYPRKFAYPFGSTGLYVMAAGLFLYLVLPWPRGAPNVVEITRWRVIGMDFLAIVVIFGVFFTLPFLIVGRSIGVVAEYWFLTAFFWFIAALGAILTYWTAYYAVLRVVVFTDRLRIVTLRGARDFRFADIEFIQPVTFLPPKWLIVASFLGVFLGRSAASTAGQLGQAMILNSSEAGGFFLQSRNGEAAYLWITDQSGNIAMRHLDRLADAMEQSKVPVKEGTLVLRGIFPPQR